MAVDEALLLSASRRAERASLRFYFWDQPTLSLGYFQRSSDRNGHIASSRCPLVRRSTGGGAIVHDLELTYSLTIPLAGRSGRSAHRYYDAFHQTLIDELATLGIKAWQYPGLARGIPGNEEPFLCFQRRAVGDVLVADSKIAGSAQRRRQDALLQHGSVLLAQSAAAPELPGIGELSSSPVDALDLARRWAERLAQRLGLEMQPDDLAADERLCSEQLVTERFADPQWTGRR